MINSRYSLPKDGGLIECATPRDIIHSYEKIHTTVFESDCDGVDYVAKMIVDAVKSYEETKSSNSELGEYIEPFVLGLTTGRTPLGLYRELVRLYNEGAIS